jgi:hypothetical protein
MNNTRQTNRYIHQQLLPRDRWNQAGGKGGRGGCRAQVQPASPFLASSTEPHANGNTRSPLYLTSPAPGRLAWVRCRREACRRRHQVYVYVCIMRCFWNSHCRRPSPHDTHTPITLRSPSLEIGEAALTHPKIHRTDICVNPNSHKLKTVPLALHL